MGRVKFLPFGAYNIEGGGVAPSPLHPFLVLIQEKDAKRKSRHQGCRPIFPAPEGALTEAGEFSQIPDFFVVRFSFFVVPDRGVLNTPHKTTRRRRSYLSIGRHIYPCGIHVGRMLLRPYPTGRRYFYHACHQFFSGIHPFLALMQEKDAKRKSRHQGCRPIWLGTRPSRF